MRNHTFLAAALSLFLGAGTAATAWGAPAYRDADSGFRLRPPEASVRMAGKDFYGYVVPDMPDEQPDESETAAKARYDQSLTCTLYAVPAAQVEAATGKPFSTEEFLRYYENLALMERNNIDPNKISYVLYDLETYRIPENGDGKSGGAAETRQAQASPSPLALVPSDLLDNSDVSLSTTKKNGNPYVVIHFVEKLPSQKEDTSDGEFERHDMELALTSANDVLYIATTAYMLPNLNNQKEYLQKDYTMLKRPKVAKQLTEDNEAVLQKHREDRDAFLKSIALFPPEQDPQPFGYTDPATKQFQPLGKDWVYFQGDLSQVYQKDEGNTVVTLAVKGMSLPKLYGIFGDTLATTNYGKESGSLEPDVLWKRQMSDYPAMLYSYYGKYPESLERKLKKTRQNLKWMGLVADVGINMAFRSERAKKYLEMSELHTRQQDLGDAMRVYLSGTGNLLDQNQKGKKYPFQLNGQVTFWTDKMSVNLLTRTGNEPLEPDMKNLVLWSVKK
ncbi:MAG: hypothetical protein ACFWT7_05320 [Succiniclasticum sp.]|jgi:hypothetical protein